VKLLLSIPARIVKSFPGEIADQPEPVGIALSAVMVRAPSLPLVGRFLLDRFKEVVDLRRSELLLAGFAQIHDFVPLTWDV